MSKPKVKTSANVPVIPAEGFVRVSQLIGCRRRGIVPILPISRSGMYAAIREGRIPAPLKLGPKVIAWPAEQIRAMIEGMKGAAPSAGSGNSIGVVSTDSAGR